MYLRSEVSDSPAFQALNGTQIKVLIEFLLLRHVRGKPRPSWSLCSNVINNGDITFTYEKAERMGYSRSTFVSAIDALVDHGFIDVTFTSGGLHQAKSYYAISDRWYLWGTERFEEKPRPKRKQRKDRGFQRGHPYYPPGRNGQEG